MKISEAQIKEIADELEMGMVCHYHVLEGEFVCIPDTDDPFFDLEPWQESLDKIEEDEEHFVKIEKMDSRRSFQVMADFTDQLPDNRLRNKLHSILDRSKPFRNFKYEIDYSDYRQDWFDFRKNAYIDWVKKQLRLAFEEDQNLLG